jgi:Acyl-CoA dehydrogenase, N-terminal domain
MASVYSLTEDQRAILDTVRRFCKEEVAPRAATLDANKDPLDCFSWEIIEKSHELGIRTMTLEEKWGGLGMDALTTAMVVEELGVADLGTSVVLAQTFKIAQIMRHDRTGQRLGQAHLVSGAVRLERRKGRGRLEAERVKAVHFQRQPRKLVPGDGADRPQEDHAGRGDLLSAQARPPRFHHRPRARQDGRASRQ